MKFLTSLIETHACQLECFAPVAELHTRTQGLLLPPRLWQILGALGQGAGASELAPRLGLPVETVHAALRAFEAEGFVSKVMIPSPALPAQDTPTPPPACEPPAAETQGRKGRVTLKLAARSRPAAQAATAAAPAATRPAPVRLRLGAAQRKTAAAAPAVATGESPASQQQAWPLQPVLDALRAKTGGDPMVGQLLAYRVFLRVPGELLQAAGIRSVCLIEPDLVIRDPKLKLAIETALQDVAGLPWPAALAAAA